MRLSAAQQRMLAEFKRTDSGERKARYVPGQRRSSAEVLERHGLLQYIERGHYRLTEKGRQHV